MISWDCGVSIIKITGIARMLVMTINVIVTAAVRKTFAKMDVFVTLIASSVLLDLKDLPIRRAQ